MLSASRHFPDGQEPIRWEVNNKDYTVKTGLVVALHVLDRLVCYRTPFFTGKSQCPTANDLDFSRYPPSIWLVSTR